METSAQLSNRLVWFTYGALPTFYGPTIPSIVTYGMIRGWPSASEWIAPGQGAWWEDTVADLTRHTQLFKHDPENKIYGDCQRTVLACMLGLKGPECVPHFCVDVDTGEHVPGGVFFDRMDAWLGEQGYRRFQTVYTGENTLQDVLRCVGILNPGTYYMLCGLSPRGTDHVVICFGDALWHDPHPDGGGIVKPGSNGYYRVEVLVPTRFTEFARPRGHEELPPVPQVVE